MCVRAKYRDIALSPRQFGVLWSHSSLLAYLLARGTTKWFAANIHEFLLTMAKIWRMSLLHCCRQMGYDGMRMFEGRLERKY